MPTGIPKTDVEHRVDVLLAAIQKNAAELHTLAYAGQDDARRLAAARAELNGGTNGGVKRRATARKGGAADTVDTPQT